MHIKLKPYLPKVYFKVSINISRLPLYVHSSFHAYTKTLQLINNYIKVSNTDYIGENKNCNPTYITSKDGSILVIYRHFWHDL